MKVRRERLVALRQTAGLSVQGLAAKAGVSRYTVYDIERGSNPREPTVKALADALGVPMDEIAIVGEPPTVAVGAA